MAAGRGSRSADTASLRQGSASLRPPSPTTYGSAACAPRRRRWANTRDRGYATSSLTPERVTADSISSVRCAATTSRSPRRTRMTRRTATLPTRALTPGESSADQVLNWQLAKRAAFVLCSADDLALILAVVAALVVGAVIGWLFASGRRAGSRPNAATGSPNGSGSPSP